MCGRPQGATIKAESHWKQTSALIKADRDRLTAYLRDLPGHEPRWIMLHPSMWAVVIHRLTYLFWRKRWSKFARFLGQFNYILTGIDINPNSEIGGGFLVTHACGTTCGGKAGRNLTLMSLSGIGYSASDTDIGAGVGLPILGDDVTVGPLAGVLGPYRVGNRVIIEPNGAGFLNIEDDCLVVPRIKATTVPLRSDPPASAIPDSQVPSCTHGRVGSSWSDYMSDLSRYSEDHPRDDGTFGDMTHLISAAVTTPLMATALYRLSHFLFVRGVVRLSMFVAWLNRLIHKATIDPSACIGGRFFLAHPVGSILDAAAGSLFSMYARTICAGAELYRKEGRAAPVIGNDVIVSGHAAILGPVTIGDHVRLGANTQIGTSLETNTVAVSAVMLVDVIQRKSHHFSSTARNIQEDTPVVSAITRHETRQHLREDRVRLRSVMQTAGKASPSRFSPAWGCVWFHRWSHYHFVRGRSRLSRLYWQLNVLLTGADINPSSDLGAGLVIPYPAGVSIRASAGRNLTLMGLCGLSGGVTEVPGIPGPGERPILGDDVYLSHHSGIYGGVHIGSNVHLEPGSYVTEDIPDHVKVLAPRNKVQQM